MSRASASLPSIDMSGSCGRIELTHHSSSNADGNGNFDTTVTLNGTFTNSTQIPNGNYRCKLPQPLGPGTA